MCVRLKEIMSIVMLAERRDNTQVLLTSWESLRYQCSEYHKMETGQPSPILEDLHVHKQTNKNTEIQTDRKTDRKTNEPTVQKSSHDLKYDSFCSHGYKGHVPATTFLSFSMWL